MKTIQTRWLEEISPGERATYGTYTFARDDVVAFAQRFDPQAFHLDEAAARESHFGALCASGWHTAAAFMKCFTAYEFAGRRAAEAAGRALPELGPSPGFENLNWLRPVFVGDTVTYSGEVIRTRRLSSKPGWGLVISQARGVNQDDQPVFSYTAKLLVPARQDGAAP